ncbi:MAG TPA: hypothetical protein VGL61_11970 [Kofleriaceae bacterium]|jgi:Flp pilus assembly protein TadB
MACPRCGSKTEGSRPRVWCSTCEKAYDTWSRQNATDIVWVVLTGGVVLAAIGMVLPLLGFEWIIAASAAFMGWGTVLGVYHWNARRRRRQFLAGRALPRAYLPSPKS